MRRFTKAKHHSSAFTLVELIVVLVILAVLAAMLVPALTGYIRKARKNRILTNADNARVACQAIMTELYGLGPGAMSNTTGDATGGGSGGDVRWDAKFNRPDSADYEWGNKVLELMDRTRDNEPYILVFGVGNSNPECNMSLTEQYTVYYVAYVESKNSPAIFYVNGEWIYTYPRDNTSIMKEVMFGSYSCRNTIVKDGVKIPLQLYVVSTYSNGNFWTGGANTLQGHAEPYFNG